MRGHVYSLLQSMNITSILVWRKWAVLQPRPYSFQSPIEWTSEQYRCQKSGPQFVIGVGDDWRGRCFSLHLYGNKDQQPPNPMAVLVELLRMDVKFTGWNDHSQFIRPSLYLNYTSTPCTMGLCIIPHWCGWSTCPHFNGFEFSHVL